jgi:prepilin-type N-terminal cleavage/methylation domain-containing protein
MKVRHPESAFTLIELLTVIAIIGVLAALTAPMVGHFRKGDAMAAATRQMLDAVHRGRQLAISQHTTVYMVFAPPTLWNDPIYSLSSSLTPSERTAATNILDKQQTGYVFVSLRSVGDQPGRSTPRFLSAWETLPDSTFIPQWKFNPLQSRTITDFNTGQTFGVGAFSYINIIPFPSEDAAYTFGVTYPQLPYIAFDYLGRLVAANGQPLNRDEYIPLAHGSVSPARNPVTRNPIPFAGLPDERELPPGNSTNSSYNVVHIDWVTGRARLERQEVR